MNRKSWRILPQINVKLIWRLPTCSSLEYKIFLTSLSPEVELARQLVRRNLLIPFLVFPLCRHQFVLIIIIQSCPYVSEKINSTWPSGPEGCQPNWSVFHPYYRPAGSDGLVSDHWLADWGSWSASCKLSRPTSPCTHPPMGCRVNRGASSRTWSDRIKFFMSHMARISSWIMIPWLELTRWLIGF